MTIADLCAVVAQMNVPHHKLDATKPTVCKWLLDNLYSRNIDNPQFVPVMRGLLTYAVSQNWLKGKEVKLYEDYLEQLETGGKLRITLPEPNPTGFEDAVAQRCAMTGMSPERARIDLESFQRDMQANGLIVTGRTKSQPEFQDLPARKSGTLHLGTSRMTSSMPSYSNIPRKG